MHQQRAAEAAYDQADAQYRMSPAGLNDFFVRDGEGQMVPLGAVATVKDTVGPQYTNRFNVYRAVQVTGAAAPGYSSGQALDALEDVARQTLPRQFGYDWSDLSYQERKASAGVASGVRGPEADDGAVARQGERPQAAPVRLRLLPQSPERATRRAD